MRRFVAAAALLFAVATVVALEEVHDLDRLLERAEEELDKDLFERTMNGAGSPRFSRKKVTDVSRAISQRNALFSKSMSLLLSDGVEETQARQMVRDALKDRQRRQKVKKRGSQGQSEYTRPTIIVEDLCDGNMAPNCGSDVFRSITGRCNNRNNPLWGSMSISMRRYLDRINSIYTLPTFVSKASSRSAPLRQGKQQRGGKRGKKSAKNGSNGGGGSGDEGASNPGLDAVNWFGVPQEGCSNQCGNQCVDNAPVELPNARFVSTNFHGDDANAIDGQVTHMVTQWGQFLDHDITLTPEEEAHDCCIDDSDPNCLQIAIPDDDYFYSDHSVTCLEFSRSTGFCEEDAIFNSSDHEQLNGITAFVDASNVYGSLDVVTTDLRTNDGSGKLKEDNNMLPVLDPTTGNRIAGDVRATEMPGLATLHTIFVREHNRICDA